MKQKQNTTPTHSTDKVEDNSERGAASIFIKLHDGTITVKHGTDKVVLHEVENAAIGSWDKLWEAIRSIKKANS